MHGQTDVLDVPDVPGRRLLDRLVRARLRPGDSTYAYFWTVGEGKYLPALIEGQRVETESGYVVTSRGAIYAFWLGWDTEQGRAALTRWRPARSQPHWAKDEEYQAARRKVGRSA
jgi:hypothetical protein